MREWGSKLARRHPNGAAPLVLLLRPASAETILSKTTLRDSLGNSLLVTFSGRRLKTSYFLLYKPALLPFTVAT